MEEVKIVAGCLKRLFVDMLSMHIKELQEAEEKYNRAVNWQFLQTQDEKQAKIKEFKERLDYHKQKIYLINLELDNLNKVIEK